MNRSAERNELQKQELKVTSYEPGARDAMFDLLRICLGERETVRRDNAYWTWKHENNPFGQSLVLLGWKDAELVGLRAFLRWKLRTNSNVISAVRAVDTVTHPDHQRQGIFSRLTLKGLDLIRAENTAFVFNTPNRNSLPGYLKMGWQRIACLPMQVRVLRPLPFGFKLLASKLGRECATAKELEGSIFRTTPRTMKEVLSTIDKTELKALIEKDAMFRGCGFTTDRSFEFLRWRYTEHPYVNYFASTVRENGRLRGMLIWRCNSRFGLSEIKICDILIDSNDSSLVVKMIKCLRSTVIADYLIAHFGKNSIHRALLWRCGFFSFPGQGINFAVRDLGCPVNPNPFNVDLWSHCLGDLEIF